MKIYLQNALLYRPNELTMIAQSNCVSMFFFFFSLVQRDGIPNTGQRAQHKINNKLTTSYQISIGLLFPSSTTILGPR